MKPLVSVIIPIYNHAPYLKERIESVLNQTYENFEVLMLEDCSPDNSAEIMMMYKDDPHVVYAASNERNTGNTFLNWERGINLAKGDYVWIAESDDVADVRFLDTLMARLIAEPEAVLAYSYSKHIDSDSRIIDDEADKPWLYEAPGVYESKWFVLRRLTMANLLYNASMIVWRKDCFANIAPDYKNYRHCGDWLFWYEVCRQGKVIEVPEQLNRFRQHAQKVTRHGERNGDNFRELGPLITHILEGVNATEYQWQVMRGRMTKRLRTEAPKGVAKELRNEFPRIFNGNLWDTIIYNIDKKTNKSKLQYKKR